MTTDGSDDLRRKRTTSLWGVILAGGEGTRLQPWIHEMTGRAWPKQFWPIRYGDTLLDLTMRRVQLVVPAERQVVVATRSHEPYLDHLRNVMDTGRLIVQPLNRGTAAGIVYPLLCLADEVGDVPVAIFPSDHLVGDDRRFMEGVLRGADLVQRRPELIALLGVEPRAPETEYGWIEPVPLAAPVLGEGLQPVRRFWEKPPRTVAESLLARGSLWNTFVMVGYVKTLLGIAEAAIPDMMSAFAPLRGLPPSPAREAAAEDIYTSLSPRDFSREVLQQTAGQLVVVRVTGVDWNDIGTPARLIQFLETVQRPPRWASIPAPALEVRRGVSPRRPRLLTGQTVDHRSQRRSA